MTNNPTDINMKEIIEQAQSLSEDEKNNLYAMYVKVYASQIPDVIPNGYRYHIKSYSEFCSISNFKDFTHMNGGTALDMQSLIHYYICRQKGGALTHVISRGGDLSESTAAKGLFYDTMPEGIRNCYSSELSEYHKSKPVYGKEAYKAEASLIKDIEEAAKQSVLQKVHRERTDQALPEGARELYKPKLSEEMETLQPESLPYKGINPITIAAIIISIIAIGLSIYSALK